MEMAVAVLEATLMFKVKSRSHGPNHLTLISTVMPREHRKRGKKHKKQLEDEPKGLNLAYAEPEVGEPSWIRSASEKSQAINVEAPFGYVDVDVKAYFRTVDEQIRGWQEADESRGVTEETTDPNEGTPC